MEKNEIKNKQTGWGKNKFGTDVPFTCIRLHKQTPSYARPPTLALYTYFETPATYVHIFIDWRHLRMHIKTITQILEQINSGTLVNQFADRIYLALLTRVTNPAVCVLNQRD